MSSFENTYDIVYTVIEENNTLEKRGCNMTTLRLGTIGTSWITEQFIEAAIETRKYHLEAVYSRTEERANDFQKKFSAKKTYTDWNAFLSDGNIDVIYIASPNSLHFDQAIQILKHQKHAIVEKPMITSLADWDELIRVAKEENKMVVEAARHLYEPNFIQATKMIQSLPEVYGASLTYSKYSSRYDNVLAGEEPPIFSPNFGGGAANDLGIYVVYAAIKWFGKPNKVHAFTRKIQTGVDGIGTAILRYDNFDVTLNFGKINTSNHPVEIYSPDETLIFDAVTGLSEGFTMNSRTADKKSIPFEISSDNPLQWEADAFAEIMMNYDTPKSKDTLAEWWTVSKQVHEVLEEIRKATT